MTAHELMEMLQADPDYVASQIQREKETEETKERFKKEEKPLLDDLRKTGWNVESAWDLVNSSASYPEAIPVLLKHLVLPYADAVREGIARSLAVRDPLVREAWPLLVAEYVKAPMGIGNKYPGEIGQFHLGYKDGLACALGVAVTDETMDEYISLLKDRAHGEYRVLLIPALGKSKNPLAKKALEDLKDDPDLKLAIAQGVRKRK